MASGRPAVSRGNVLAITSEVPWPLNSGGHIRTFHLLKALAAATDLRLVVPVHHHETQAVEAVRAVGISVVGVPVGVRTPWREAGRMLTAGLLGEPYVMYRRHLRHAVARAWRAELRGRPPDVLYLDHLDSAVYRLNAGRGFAGPSVIDFHNSYSLLVERQVPRERNTLRRAFLGREARLLEKMERRAARACNAVLAVSDQEADYFRRLGASSVRTIPNGVDCASLVPLPTGRCGEPIVLFLGTMSWGPNADAARFLAQEVLPVLQQRLPHARLLVVGRNPPADLLALGERLGIEVTGGVDDIRPYLERAALLAVPLDVGGGTRLKILEAFAAGLPVVSTAVGAEGIAARPGIHYVRAERNELVDAIAGLLEDPAAGARLAQEARGLALKMYDWPRIAADCVSIVERLAGRSPICTSPVA
jgi:glycosyltransferase involved in cell wall biosynthesis